MSDRRILDANEDYQALAEAHGSLANKLGAQLEATAAEVGALRNALRDAIFAWDTAGWMAEHYAEAGGEHAPEMRNYRKAAALIEQARAVLRETAAHAA